MQTLHRSLRKAVSCLVTLLLTFAIFASSSAAPISDTFTYDANGNMISGSGLSFIYNDANQLVKIINESDSSTVAEYFYDANGQRVKKIEGGVTTYYIGDYVETRMNGSTVDNTSYYFANNERVARKDPDGSKFYYLGDHLGSTHVVSDESGAQSEKVSYYPYGSMKERVGEGSTYLFTDQEFDDESGLYYYDARYYNPELTRFTQPDTITQDVYNPQNLNKYAYVLNNPLKYTDPTGHVVVLGLLAVLVIYGVYYEVDYCMHNPVDPSNPMDLVNIWVEGGKGLVVGTAHYFSGKLAGIMGGDKIVQGGTGAFGARVSENVLEGEENIFEGTPESTAAGVVAGKIAHSQKIITPEEIVEVPVLKTGEAAIEMIEDSMFSEQYEQHDYEYSPYEHLTLPYYDSEHPYGVGADAKSYTASTNYYPPEWEEKR